MSKNHVRRLAILLAVLVLLSACGTDSPSQEPAESGALTWGIRSNFDAFFALAAQTYPEIDLAFTAYAGANGTGYTWAQMRADDIPDIFVSSQILDGNLAADRLADLSNYEFVSSFATSFLDQVAVDGGVYLLPVNTAMYGIYYNKTLMEEHGWAVPTNFAELETLCGEIEKAGLIPGVIGTRLTGNTFSAMFNLAKTGWLTTPEGIAWEQDFLAGNAAAEGRWDGTVDYAQKYMDIGMLHTDPEDRDNFEMLQEYLGNRKSVFFTAAMTAGISEFPNGDKLGMMPYISEDGSKNIYMYSHTSYIGLSKRLLEPGNEKKLEDAVKLLSLLFSPEGQAAFVTGDTPCYLSVLDSASVPEDALIYDAQQALQESRAFQMTYVHWENILSDIGQAFKDWFRGENGMDGPGAIRRMDELQKSYLNSQETVYFSESTADFTLEETARLVAKALGSAVGADAAMVPYTDVYKEGFSLVDGVTGKLYGERINADVANTICPRNDGTYTILTMTGKQLKELAAAGFDYAEDGAPCPYALEVRGGGEPEDAGTYRVALSGNTYTEETASAYSGQVEDGSLREYVRNWLMEQKTVSPDGNPWE